MATGATGSGAGVSFRLSIAASMARARLSGSGPARLSVTAFGNPFGDVGASQMAKDIGGDAPGRRDPALQSLAADGEQRDLLPQNGERGVGRPRLRVRQPPSRLFSDPDRRLAGREAVRKPIRRRVGPAGKLAALLYGIKPLNDLVNTGQAVADEASGNRAIAPANR